MDEPYTVTGLKEAMRPNIASTQRVRINNILVSADWAAVHYWDATTHEDGSKDAANHMQFLHFVEDSGSLKIDLCWSC